VAERNVKALILAAGMSTRLKSKRSKVLHEICGKRILSWVLEACREAGIDEQIVVVGAVRDQVQQAYADVSGITWVVQKPQQGTGHAVMAAENALEGFTGDLVVLMGDAPLIRPETLRTLVDTHRDEQAAVTLITAILEDPKWFGRIVRDAGGNLQGIVEARDATPEQAAIKEVNPAYYCFRWPALRDVLPLITNDNVKGEYYLTDAVGLLIHAGNKAIAVPAAEASECEAVNSRSDLARVRRLAQRRILEAHMAAGVTIEDPATTTIETGVEIGADTVIGPCTIIRGPATIGGDCRVGPLAHVPAGTTLEDGAEVTPPPAAPANLEPEPGEAE
jgi:bifunctional UDP-N-acetylglucosamine pyrophosphorylase/glucosamine-1-phosphate N-acetyltransferase